ncbi:MAG: uroporphyrinogen decarboxylase [bacterium]|nr:uroporphyrinogen decarboxylase [bacterium]
MSQSNRFLQACRREHVDRTPVWLMRQAGRYMAEYRALKEKYSFLEMVKTPELAAEVTMQPVNAYAVDAAIIFQDILPILEPMGLHLEYVKGEGPVIHNPVRSAADVDALQVRPAAEALAFAGEAIRQVRQELAGKVPLIGFSGAPFTLVCYAIEGGASRNYTIAKGLMYGQPDVWKKLMEKMSAAVADYLKLQAASGAQVLQVFDSWVGALSPADYETYVLPYTRQAIEAVKDAFADIPLIHFGTGTGGMLHLMKAAGGDVIGVDWREDLAQAWDGLGNGVAVQGNLDPVILFAPVEEIRKQAARILDSVRGRPGHIFNLGHGILQHTPVDHVAALVDFVHEYTGKD